MRRDLALRDAQVQQLTAERDELRAERDAKTVPHVVKPRGLE
jgi:hypothetical protein